MARLGFPSEYMWAENGQLFPGSHTKGSLGNEGKAPSGQTFGWGMWPGQRRTDLRDEHAHTRAQWDVWPVGQGP